MDSRRAESFSDGVFAVAITVLVFNLLPIASKTAQSLSARTLGGYWPAYLAYLVSFLTIGIMWLNHHTMLSRISKVDRVVLVLNLLLLMGVVAIPFPTALVADHLNDGSQGKVAAVTYGLVMILISIGYASLWVYLAAHQQALGARRRVRTPRLTTFRFTAGNGGYVAGTLVALLSPVAALIIFGLLAVYYLFEQLPEARADEAGQDQACEDGQVWTGQDRAGQENQVPTGQDRASQDQGAEDGEDLPGEKDQDRTGQDQAVQLQTGQDQAVQLQTGQDQAVRLETRR
jgi:uncharacterized membrane protein